VIRKVSAATQGAIKKQPVPDPELRFSFRFFDHADQELCPPVFSNGYCQTLMQRLRDVSTLKVKDFTGRQDKALRNHQHEWDKTSRPDGFAHLNEHYRAYPGWQFCLSANEHGRVHGIIIDDTFYVIWLDKGHALYPGA
jgi:hypothetical protein